MNEIHSIQILLPMANDDGSTFLSYTIGEQLWKHNGESSIISSIENPPGTNKYIIFADSRALMCIENTPLLVTYK